MSEVTPDIILNVKGRNCPSPLLLTRKLMETLTSGLIIELVATDPTLPEDITNWARDHDRKILKTDKVGEEFHILIQV